MIERILYKFVFLHTRQAIVLWLTSVFRGETLLLLLRFRAPYELAARQVSKRSETPELLQDPCIICGEGISTGYRRFWRRT